MIQARSMVEITVLGLIETHKPARWEGVMKVYASQCALHISPGFSLIASLFYNYQKNKLQYKKGVFKKI